MASRSVLLDLPREIQDAIWHQYFKHVVVFVCPVTCKSDGEAKTRRPAWRPRSDWSVLGVSKEINAVAKPAFQKHATFHHQGCTRAQRDDLVHLLGTIPSAFPWSSLEKISDDPTFGHLFSFRHKINGLPYARIKQITIKDIVVDLSNRNGEQNNVHWPRLS